MLWLTLLLCIVSFSVCEEPDDRIDHFWSEIPNESPDTSGLSPNIGDTTIDNGGNNGNSGSGGTINNGGNDGSNPCKVGKCVPYYQCSNGATALDREELLDIHLSERDQNPCNGYLQICCSSLLPSDIVDLFPKMNKGCGYRNTEGVGFRIADIKDSEAEYGEFPWTVALLKEERQLDKMLNVYQCAGSLIHPSVVLTAAHCVMGKEPTSLKIRAGEWDTQTTEEIFPHQDRQVSEFITHEQYHKGGLFNDVALLFLVKPVEITETASTICLPAQDQTFDLNRCFASGWGRHSFDKEILKSVELPIMPRDKCLKEFRKHHLGIHFELHQSFICAGGERGNDTCRVNGGWPLVCPIPNTVNRYYQAGIGAWGIACDDSNPGVYVNVPLFRNWIEEKLQYKGIPNTFLSQTK